MLLGITFFSCINEDLNNHSQNQRKIELTKNEVLSIAYDDAKQLSDEDIFNVVNDFANLESNCMTRNTATSFKITKELSLMKMENSTVKKLKLKLLI